MGIPSSLFNRQEAQQPAKKAERQREGPCHGVRPEESNRSKEFRCLIFLSFGSLSFQTCLTLLLSPARCTLKPVGCARFRKRSILSQMSVFRWLLGRLLFFSASMEVENQLWSTCWLEGPNLSKVNVISAIYLLGTRWKKSEKLKSSGYVTSMTAFPQNWQSGST